MIFIFLSCREKAQDNKEFSHENSKPGRVNHKFRLVKSNPDLIKLKIGMIYHMNKTFRKTILLDFYRCAFKHS